MPSRLPMPGRVRRRDRSPRHRIRASSRPTKQSRSRTRGARPYHRRPFPTNVIPWPVRRAARRGSLAFRSCATRRVPARWSNTEPPAFLPGPVHRESPASVRHARPSTSASALAAAHNARGCAASRRVRPASARPGCFVCRSTSKDSEAVCERRAEGRPASWSAACRSTGLPRPFGLWRTRRTDRAADAARLERRGLDATMCGG